MYTQHMPQEQARILLSSLQDKILRLICTRREVGYSTLIEKTKRDRTTILQSVESLIKHGLIVKQKIDPEYEKSKLIFRATNIGKQIAYNHLGVNLEDIMSLEENKQITGYLNFIYVIRDITDPLQQKALLRPLSEIVTQQRASDYDREMFKEGIKKTLLELLDNKDYKVEKVFNNKSIELFIKLFTPHEMREIKEYLQQIAKNANLTNESLTL